MSFDGLYYKTLIDPSGEEHQIGEPKCSGCVWESAQPQCMCGGILHYWLEDEDEVNSFVAFECDKCGKNEQLKPTMSEELA